MIYEYPLTEGMRRLLRIEMLFEQAESYMAIDSTPSTLAAIRTLLDIVGLVSKNDLKIELLRILDRAILDENYSEAERSEMEEVKRTLNHLSIRAYDSIKENVFLNVLKQRINIPGGVCGFDLPALHHWLQKPHAVRKEHFYRWFAVLRVIQEAIGFVLAKIRAKVKSREITFENGFYYCSIKWPALLVRLNIEDHDLYPEFSGNRHQLSIRLMRQASPWEEGKQVEDKLTLEMSVCGRA